MRRLTSITSVVLACLVLGGVPAAARAGTVAVTATQDCTIGSDPVPCTYTASDPRLTGRGGHTFVEARSPDEGAMPGSAVAVYVTDAWIQGPEGAWTGHHLIVVDEAGVAHAMLMLAGAGAYDGLSFVGFGSDPNADADGITFELRQGEEFPSRLYPLSERPWEKKKPPAELAEDRLASLHRAEAAISDEEVERILREAKERGRREAGSITIVVRSKNGRQGVDG